MIPVSKADIFLQDHGVFLRSVPLGQKPGSRFFPSLTSGKKREPYLTKFKSNVRETWRVILVSKADIFHTESLRILAERLSQSET